MEIKRVMPPNIVTEEIIFIKDKPNLYRNDGPCTVKMDMKSMTGSFTGPARMFDVPQRGDLFDVKMRSSNVWRCVVAKCDQDYTTCKGELIVLTHADRYRDYLAMGYFENKQINTQ